MSLPVPSTNDTEYSVSVVAVDTGGRYMDPVGERTFVADGKYINGDRFIINIIDSPWFCNWLNVKSDWSQY